MHLPLEFIQLQGWKPHTEFNTQERIEAGKNGDKDGSALYKLINDPTDTPHRRRFDVDITSIRQRPNFDKFPRHLHVLFRCNFEGWKIHVVSTYFFRWSFDGQRIPVVSTYLYRCNLDGPKIPVTSTYFSRCVSMVEKPTLFSPIFLGVISMVQKPTLFPRTFFDVILMVEKVILFPLTFSM